eukprot:m.21942 g.21942  ORF g.21942 m.21942 type:complete len:389 (-) comp5748_c0_seq2:230-1396(-)
MVWGLAWRRAFSRYRLSGAGPAIAAIRHQTSQALTAPIVLRHVCEKQGYGIKFEKCTLNGPERVRITVTCDEQTILSDVDETQAAVATSLLPHVQQRAAEDDRRPRVDLVALFRAAWRHNILDIASPGVAASISQWVDTCHKSGARPVIAVDCEGIGLSPPALVQIAGPGFVALDFPASRSPPTLSATLKELLQDERVTKVFACGRGDLVALRGCGVRISSTVDVQDLVAQSIKGATSLGLARCVSFALPGVQFSKNGYVRVFTEVDQGRLPPPISMASLRPQNIAYAAMDAWIVLHIFYLVQARITRGTHGRALPKAVVALPTEQERRHAALKWCVEQVRAALPRDVPQCIPPRVRRRQRDRSIARLGGGHGASSEFATGVGCDTYR